MELIVQSDARPGVILEAITSLAAPDVTALRLAVAYTTLGGSELLVPELSKRMGAAWATAPKTLITSFDYGCTDPDALEYWAGQPRATVYVANAALAAGGNLRPARAFHPKFYVFDRGGVHRYAAGSANLTTRAFTINTEVLSVERAGAARLEVHDWTAMLATASRLDPALLAQYRAVRGPGRAPEVDDPPTPLPVVTAAVPAFFEEVLAGRLNPALFARFWVEAGTMSTGGSHNILEVPRYANRFFGFTFNNYTAAHIVIGHPVLTHGVHRWTDRQLTWHGAPRMNKMERITLPTRAQGGFAYENTCVLFRRHPGGYELQVTPWTSPLAVSWRNASAQARHVYRLGASTRRICGLIPQ